MKKIHLFLLLAASCGFLGQAQAVSFAINFDSSTAAVVSSEYGVPAPNWTNTTGANGVGIVLAGLIGATVSWTSANTFSYPGAATNAAKGYLDDGNASVRGATVTLSGLLAALQGVEPTVTGYTLQLLYSSRDATGFSPAGLNGINGVFTTVAGNGQNVGKVELSGVSPVQTSAVAAITGENRNISLGQNRRGSIAAVIIQSVPEPGAAALSLFGLAGWVCGRRRRA